MNALAARGPEEAAQKVTPAQTNLRRLTELDSLRGLAAISVVLHHFRWLWWDSVMVGQPDALRNVVWYLLYPFTGGHEAVILFFILSGFVLSIPAINGTPQPYGVFVARRICRIYLPYLCALGIAVSGDWWLHGYVTQSAWFHEIWSEPVDWRLVCKHVAFIGEYNSHQFDPPIWSLIYEMRISLVFPVLCAVALKMRSSWSMGFAVIISMISIGSNVALSRYHLAESILTLHYAAFFIIGIYLAREKGRISKLYKSLPKIRKVLLAVVTASLYAYSAFLWGEGTHRITGHYLNSPGEWFTALGGTGVIIISLNSEVCRGVLNWRPIHVLGQVSYSVYLIHFIVLLLLVHLLYGHLPLLIILALCLVATVAGALVFHRVVEKPSIDLGRRVRGRVPAKAVEPATI